MAETNSIVNPQSGGQWDASSLMQKLVEVQNSLLETQEKNIVLSAQLRELDRVARDAEDLKTELANQNQLLNDKVRENKQLHQELSRVMNLLDSKIQEITALDGAVAEVQHQLKTCQSERDLLSVMLTESEKAARQAARKAQEQEPTGGEGGKGASPKSGKHSGKALAAKQSASGVFKFLGGGESN